MAKEKNTSKSEARKRRGLLPKKLYIVLGSTLGLVVLAGATVLLLVALRGDPAKTTEPEWQPNADTLLRESFDAKVTTDPDAAKELYDSALDASEDQAERTKLRIARTTALSENGKHDEAIVSALESIEQQRTHETLIAASWAYNLKQDRAKALEYAKEARTLLDSDTTMNELDKQYAAEGYDAMISELSSWRE